MDPFTLGHPALSPTAIATGFDWRGLRNGGPSHLSRLTWGNSQLLGKDIYARRRKDVECRKLQRLFAGKSETDVKSNTEAH